MVLFDIDLSLKFTSFILCSGVNSYSTHPGDGVWEHFLSLKESEVEYRPHLNENSQPILQSVLFSSLSTIPNTIHIKLTTLKPDGRVEIVLIFLSFLLAIVVSGFFCFVFFFA